jgi:hypothetical protein
MPICKYWRENDECPNENNCDYRHPKNEHGPVMGNIKGGEKCPYYERGFCKLGTGTANFCGYQHGDFYQ